MVFPCFTNLLTVFDFFLGLVLVFNHHFFFVLKKKLKNWLLLFNSTEIRILHEIEFVDVSDWSTRDISQVIVVIFARIVMWWWKIQILESVWRGVVQLIEITSIERDVGAADGIVGICVEIWNFIMFWIINFFFQF